MKAKFFAVMFFIALFVTAGILQLIWIDPVVQLFSTNPLPVTCNLAFAFMVVLNDFALVYLATYLSRWVLDKGGQK